MMKQEYSLSRDITGTLIKNFFHCKRQAWLYYYGINFYSELTRIGKLKHLEEGSEEIVLDNIKVDKIQDDKVIEFKKTSSNLEGNKMQLLFYMWKLKQKGIQKKGLLKDLTYKKEYEVELNEENENKLKEVFKNIQRTIEGEMPERLPKKKLCRGCSFFDYCWST